MRVVDMRGYVRTVEHDGVQDAEYVGAREEEELMRVFSMAGVAPEEHIVAYCNGGVAATSVLFSLAMLGYPNLTNYDGSWNEWGSRQDLPAEV
jgi:thiosulfate/3-mercaptopyruvate sulfurtransferase